MRRAVLALVVVGGLGLTPASAQDAPKASEDDPASNSILAADLEAHVRALADDEMQGRGVRGGGLELAATYVRDRMKAIGLQPAGATPHSYFHQFVVGKVHADIDGHIAARRDTKLTLDDGWISFTPGSGTWAGHLVSGGKGDDDAFAALRTQAAGVKGAWIVVHTGRRVFDNTTFSLMPKFARQAQELQALGVIHVPAEDLPASTWRRVRRMFTRPRPAAANDLKSPGRAVAIWMQRQAFERLVGEESAGGILDGEPGAGAVRPAPGDDVLSITLKSELRDKTSYQNICGRLVGSHPTLKSQHVAFSAHYDHLGAGAVPKGVDGIFNGADDDASGVAAILELAQAFTIEKPKRSILVIAFTAEEQGLLGSKQWAKDPTVPLASIVADFNVEMIGRPARAGPGHLWITGFTRSTFGTIVADAAAAVGVTAKADPYPGQGFFRRSDNYSLAKHGIPAHSLSSFNNHGDYHQVTDEADKIDFANMETLTRGIFAGARRIASGAATPTWAAGDPLGDVRRAGK